MSLSQNPVNFAMGMPRQLLQWAQSLHKTINGSIDLGTPTGKDSNGVYNKFSKGNSSGILLRVGASGSTENDYSWTSSATAVAINHALGRQPIGAHLVSSDKPLNIYQTQAPSDSTIHIAPSDATANATIYIF